MKHLGHTLQLFALILVLALFTSPALAAEPQQVTGGEPVVSLSTTDLLILVFGVALLVFQVARKPQQADSNLVLRLSQLENNREWMDRMERAYQQSRAHERMAFDTIASLFRLVAPITPFKGDDATARLMQDIQTPGEMMAEPLAYDPYKSAVFEPHPESTATKSIYPPPDTTTPQG